ncbi:MAG TPA: metalloregulator ArsR/SmtB family transcription factor [Rhizobiales bacterium]|nr:metalloregulator ArsR/SmtB family transcription factor [Hyphomicrobiales bacterium]
MPLAVLSALAEPTRLAAMQILADGSEHCVCELMKRLDATQSRMSRHMQTLKQAGLVTDRRDAQWVRYRLNPNLAPDTRAILEAVMAAAGTEERAAA